MAKVAKEASTKPGLTDEELAARAYIMTPEEFDDSNGQEYGGQSDVVIVQVGECAGPFTYCGHTQVTTDLGETTSHTAFDSEGDQIRLPLQASFLKALDQARVGVGDLFAIRRYDDAIKKKGKGAGNPMAIYSVKVLQRASEKAGEVAKAA